MHNENKLLTIKRVNVMSTNVRKKGVKAIIRELNVGEFHLFERRQYSNIRTTMSVTRIENPGRDWELELVDNGIKVTCIS